MTKIYTTLLAFLFISSSAYAQLEGTTWRIAPQASALVVGPAGTTEVWWENSGDDITTRDCFFDDDFVFAADGTFSNVLGASTWLEPWQAGTEECGTPVAPHDGSSAATWSYDASAGTVTINGLGAYIGLPKVHNNGELMSPSEAVNAITYPVTFSNNDETMTIVINYGAGDWKFILEKQAGTSSVTELEETLFSFYPNPATNEIQINAIGDIDELIITDMTGKQMMTQRNLSVSETIDVSGFAGGLYIIECRSGNQVSTEKLVIRK